MGLLINGKWQNNWYNTQASKGEFIRESSQYLNWITKDGAPGPTGTGGFKAEPHRYHLYVSYACPWAHRTLIFRAIKKLTHLVSVSVVHPHMLDQGWALKDSAGESSDTMNHCDFLHQVYTLNDPTYNGRVTVPLLWDSQQKTIVCNESSLIIRMFNTAFNQLTGDETDYYPTELQADIDAINDQVYENINNGVYRCGFATQQAAYERAYDRLFATLDTLEQRLSQQRYLVGSALTEADWRLFTTLIRFDAVYYGHFKCNRQQLADYPHLSHYLRELYQFPGVAETVHFSHIKNHYYYSHETINPTRIVPKGPALDFSVPHNRYQLEKNHV